MPALAVTEHGNMFSSVIFHDHAKQRGVNPILGCEVYVAPGSRLTKSGNIGETANHLVLLAETNEGYHNLIKLVSSGYTEGFYYKPRIDKDLLAQHSKGLIGLSSCLKGEVASEIRTGRERKALEAAAQFRDILGRGQLFPRDAVSGHRRAAGRQQRAGADRARSEHAARGDQRRALPAARRSSPARHPALHRHGQERQRSRSAAVPRRSVLSEDRRGNAEGLRRDPRGARKHAAHRRTVPRRYSERQELPAELRRAGALHAERLLRARRARRIHAAAGPPEGAARVRRAATSDRGLREPPVLRDRDDQADGISRLLPHRLGFHPLRAREEHSGRARPRIGGRQPRGVLPAHHRRRSARLRPHLRAVPQPRARVAARYRHRLLRAAPRRGHRVRHAEIRPRERRADHHVRHDEGARRRARRGALAGHSVRRRRSRGEADSAGARHDAREGARGSAAAEGS